MNTYKIEYALFGNPKHRFVEWDGNTIGEAVKDLIKNEMAWFRIPRGAVRVFKVDGINIDEEEIWPVD